MTDQCIIQCEACGGDVQFDDTHLRIDGERVCPECFDPEEEKRKIDERRTMARTKEERTS